MPTKAITEKARKDLRQGKKPSTAAGEFVREEIKHVRQGKHGARSTKQAIAIGLSQARRAGVPLSPPKKGQTSERTRRSAERAYEVGQGKAQAAGTFGPAKQSGNRRAAPRTSRCGLAQVAVDPGPEGGLQAQAEPDLEVAMATSSRGSNRWSKEVTENSNALDLEEGVFGMSPKQMARSLKRSAERSKRRKSPAFRSAMSMLNFFENRAGRNLPASRKKALHLAKDELRKLYGRQPQG